MKLKLTETNIAAMKPKAKVFEIGDAAQPGLALRIYPTGSKRFKVRFGRSGVQTFKPAWPSLTLEAARERARAVLVEIDQRGAPIGQRPKATARSFGAFIDDEYATTITGNKAADATLANLRAQFGGWWKRPLASISTFDVSTFTAKRLKAGINAATVCRDLDRLRAALNTACKLGLIQHNPVLNAPRPKFDNKRVRFLSADEEKRLRKALADREKARRRHRAKAAKRHKLRGRPSLPVWPEDRFTDRLMPLVIVAMNTGLRRGELLGLEWSAVDLERRLLTVTASTSKSQRVRHVPLNDEATDVLTRWKKQGSAEGLVFPHKERVADSRKAWNAVVEAAKLKDFRFHDLRHHFASRMAMAGVDMYAVQTLLGHSESSLTQRYAHLAPEHLAAAVATLGARR